MGNFFLLNEAIDVNHINDFKNGIIKLSCIKFKEGFSTFKHNSVYNTNIFLKFCQLPSVGQDTILILKFIEQLKMSEYYIDSVKSANQYFGSELNGFLGIDFSNLNIIESKQITCENTFINCVSTHSLTIDRLRQTLGGHLLLGTFQKDFNNAHKKIQESIIDGFTKARKRNLFTPFYPDTKIIKDVTPTNSKVKIMELRVYSPQALRVYFHESDNHIYIANFEFKNNPNQSIDISKSSKILNDAL